MTKIEVIKPEKCVKCDFYLRDIFESISSCALGQHLNNCKLEYVILVKKEDKNEKCNVSDSNS